MRTLGVLLALLLVPLQSPAQNSAPIIDMHMHAGIVGGDLSLGLCVPWVTQFPARGPNRTWQQVWLEAMTNPPCSDPIWSPAGKTAMMEQTIAVLERRNIIGVLTGAQDDVLRWRAAAPARFIPSVGFKIGRDDISPQAMRKLFASGAFAMLGEVSNQYAGIPPGDARMEPYWALAEELDIPVAIHMGEGTVGTAFTGFPGLSEYRVRLSSPYLLEEVLIRHPRLRISMMHYGSPLVDETIAMLGAYPQLYVDLGGRQWYYPRAYFYRHLRQIVDAGFGKRIMFGSDQGDWPGVIEVAIRIIEEATFLSEEHKRDILYNNAARFLRLSDEEIARHHGR